MVAFHNVGDFVREYAREFRLGVQPVIESLGDQDIAGRRGKAVHVRILGHAETPVQLRPVRLQRDPAADLVYIALHGRIVDQRRGAEQVGFARVVTDKATFAYLGDVFILDAHRGQGLSKRLMAMIAAHPDLQGLRRFMLATKDAHGLYEQFGFRALGSPSTYMEILRPDVYQQH